MLEEGTQIRKPIGCLITGLVLSILSAVVYFAVMIVIFIIYASVLFTKGTAEAAGATVNEADLAWMGPVLTIFTILVIYSMAVSFPLSIVALILTKKANKRKQSLVAGILAIFAGLSMIIIPVEFIGGVILCKMTDDDFIHDPNYWHD